MTVLSGKEITRLIKNSPPLLEEYQNLDEQLQPNGFDITLREIGAIKSAGRIAVDNGRRQVSDLETCAYDENGYAELKEGQYVITFNEIVHLPNNVMALGKPRSSLLRCGVAIHNAVWDAGYSGRSQALLVVYNPFGFTVQKNARVLQLIFMQLSSETAGYQGIYQNENIK